MRSWPALLAFALVLRASPAGADDAADPQTAAASLYARAEAEDARGDYKQAVADYRAAVGLLPSFRFAARAMTRAALLDAHSEGNWGPYSQLEAVRRDPAATSDPKAIGRLATAADAFPAGPTRGEARMVCAQAYGRLNRRAEGETELRKVVDDPSADGLLRREAASLLVNALLEDGSFADAQATAARLGTNLDVSMAARVTELVRRHRVHLAAVADLSVFALLAVVALARASLRGALANVLAALKPTSFAALGFAAYLAVAGGWLASSYETGNATPFFAFGVALVPIALAARAWGAAGRTSTAARALRAVVSASAVMATAFLLLELINGQYLEGFNL